MEVLKWKKDKEIEDAFYKIKKINTTYYKLTFSVYYYNKSIKIEIAASSGNKRKHLDDYTVNNFHRDGGIKALLWLRDEINGILDFLEGYYILGNRKRYISIAWEDSQRRNVYSRLQKEGFYFMMDEGRKVLIKRI